MTYDVTWFDLIQLSVVQHVVAPAVHFEAHD